VPRWLVALALVSVVCAVVVLFGLWPLAGADLLMHLTVGRWIWEHGWVPITDPFSYITEGQTFIAHSWLAELAFYLVERRAGTVGFMGLRCALIGVAPAFAARVAQILRAPWPALMLLAPFVFGLMWGRLEFRPQLFTSAPLAAELWLIMSVHTGRRSCSWLWALPPGYALWINLHAGWVQGVAMLAAITGARVVMEVRRRSRGSGATSHLPLRHMALVLGACALALFMNPYGARLLSLPFEMQAPWIRQMGFEWQSPFANEGWRMVGGGVFVPMQPAFLSYTALLGGVLLVTVRRCRTGDLVPIAVMGLWLGLSSWHLRAVADTALISAPFVAASFGSSWRDARRWPVWAGIGLLIGLTWMGLWFAWQVPDWRWTRAEPRCVESAAERLGRPVRVFGSGATHWLLFRLSPLVRADLIWEYVAGPQRTAEFRAVWKGQASTRAYLERYQVDLILFKHGDFRDGASRSVPLLTAMGLVLTHLDDGFFMMAPRRPDTEDLIRREGYRFIVPWAQAPVTPANAAQVLEEANRALRHCPDGARFAYMYKSAALYLLGRDREAFKASLEIPEEVDIE
jgi:hypothetical protein